MGLGLLGMALHSGLELAAGRSFVWRGYGRPGWWMGGLALVWGGYYVGRLVNLSLTGALAEAMAQAPLGQWWAGGGL
ncbi:MAG: hypothetical protein IGQ88_02865 [Gloeomargaritaceae cyanobacterium C42_A2020_066]|nr:hypothetical protein [Gloeomargaritaceae cyanobacterium C42_A2020_066]